MSKGNNVSIFEKYHNYSKKVILISIKVITPEERIYIKHKYGSDFLGDGYLLRSEETRFAWAEKSLEEKLEKVQKMVDSGYSEEYIINNLTKVYASPYKAYYNRLKTPQLIQLKSSFTENFTPKIQLKVEKCLPNLSVEEKDLISEFYWGKKYEILKKDVDKRKIPALKKLINKIQEEYIYQLPKNVNQKSNQQSKTEFLAFFEEDKTEEVLKIVENFQVTNPNYYEVIHKIYSGERLEIRNYVTLSKQDSIILNNAKLKIKSLLKKDIKNKVHAIEDIILFLPKIIQENSIFYYIETMREKIFKIVSIDDIVDYYILHLSAFYETDIVEILKVIATYKSEKIETVMNSSYIKEKLQFLTPKEQMYFYLKLKSYNTTELTNKKISGILNIEESFLEQYRIMTIDEETNQLNQIIKNKNR